MRRIALAIALVASLTLALACGSSSDGPPVDTTQLGATEAVTTGPTEEPVDWTDVPELQTAVDDCGALPNHVIPNWEKVATDWYTPGRDEDSQVFLGRIRPMTAAGEQIEDSFRTIADWVTTNYPATGLDLFRSFKDPDWSYLMYACVAQRIETDFSGRSSSTPAPTLVPTPKLGTRENPGPIGTTLYIGKEWDLNVVAVSPDALGEIMAENRFNDPPAEGRQFFMTTVEVIRRGAEAKEFDASYALRSVGPTSVSYSTFENPCGVIPNPFPSSELFQGGTLQGNVCWEVKTEDAAGLVMYYDEFLQDSDDRLFLSLH